MKKIGKQVLFLETGEGNPRNGEGSFVRLKDGRIMYAYTEYYGTRWEDESTARLSVCYSCDEGESWSAHEILLEKDETAENYMSVSLMRLSDGALGMIYLRKEKKADGTLLCMPLFRRSEDEGKSWSEPISCVARDGYYCGINDGAIVQKNGRILMPLSDHVGVYDDLDGTPCALKRRDTVIVTYSDDHGKTWGVLPHLFIAPFHAHSSLAEPGLYERDNGELWLWARTPYGHQYESRSRDGGKTWSSMMPNFYFTSPDAPMRVKRVGSYTVAVFNPKGYNCLREDYSSRGSILRVPLVCAVSRDDGASFDINREDVFNQGLIRFAESCYLLENDDHNRYCYPTILEVKDGFLVAYYHSNGGEYTLNCAKMVKVLFSELEQKKNTFFSHERIS